MISKVTKGDYMRGLIAYLFQEGEHDEHVGQQAVAVSEGVEFPVGVLTSKDEQTFLSEQLNMPRVLHQIEGKSTWHLSLSVADGEELSEAQWGDIAKFVMKEMQFDDDVLAPAPWVAMTHDADIGNRQQHMHIAASQVRVDGTFVNLRFDYNRVGELAAHLEREYGLTIVDGRKAGSAPAPTRGEMAKAEREGRGETERETLARKVRAASVQTGDERAFRSKLEIDGVEFRPSVSKDGKSVRGMSLKLDAAGSSWFAASDLGRDLSLPQLRKSWTKVDDDLAVWTEGRETAPSEAGTSSEETTSWEEAKNQVGAVTARLKAAGPEEVGLFRDSAAGASGLTAVMSERIEAGNPGSYAAQSARLADTAHLKTGRNGMNELRSVALLLAQGSVSSRQDQAGWIILLAQLAELSATVQRMHQARGELHRSSVIELSNQAIAADVQTLVNQSVVVEPGTTVTQKDGAVDVVGVVKSIDSKADAIGVSWADGSEGSYNKTELNVVLPAVDQDPTATTDRSPSLRRELDRNRENDNGLER